LSVKFPGFLPIRLLAFMIADWHMVTNTQVRPRPQEAGTPAREGLQRLTEKPLQPQAVAFTSL
jgi:hypothetical protein